MGQQLGDRLERIISQYIAARPGADGVLQTDKLRIETLPWVRNLPQRFQEELEGLAAGANTDLQTVAEWLYVEMSIGNACSGFVYEYEGDLWIGRNNDSFVPDMWGFVMIREVENRIPTMGFSLEGSPAMPTGVNRERLWLHVNALGAGDSLTGIKPHGPSWLLLTDALELCSSIDDVEHYLNSVERDDGSLLFAVDGKTNEAVVFECERTTHQRRNLSEQRIVGTNHRCLVPESNSNSTHEHRPNSQDRFDRVDQMLGTLFDSRSLELPNDLIQVLADDGVERRGTDFATVYSNVACPARREVWYTYGGYPAASSGDWDRVEWPWPDSD